MSMKGPDGNFYKEFGLFMDYYGDADYGDKWITAAARKQKTGFKSGYVVACRRFYFFS